MVRGATQEEPTDVVRGDQWCEETVVPHHICRDDVCGAKGLAQVRHQLLADLAASAGEQYDWFAPVLC